MQQAIIHNTIECPCCDRVWLSLLSAGGSPTLYYEPQDPALLASVVWQENVFGDYIWTDVQTGGTVYLDYTDGLIYRVKYTDSKGCIHYSNTAYGFDV